MSGGRPARTETGTGSESEERATLQTGVRGLRKAQGIGTWCVWR